MPPEVASTPAATVQQTNTSDTQSVAALEGAFSKAIDGGGLKKDPATGRFTSTKAKAAPAQAEAAPADTESTAAPAQGDGAAPSEETPSGDTAEQQTKAEPSSETPIEPPAFWSKDRHDLFKALHRDAQEYIVQRERERDVETRRGQNESAETRKAAEAERTAISQERQSLAQQASLYVSAEERKFIGDYADLKSWDDLRALSDIDPARVQRMNTELQIIDAKRREAAVLQQRVAAEARKELEAFRTAEDKAFRDSIPGFADDAKWQAHQKELADFAKGAGIAEDEVAQASRSHLAILRDAMQWRRSQAALAKARTEGAGTTAAPAKVQQPGAARGGTGKDGVAAALMQRVRAEGSTEAAEALFAHALNKGAKGDTGKRNVR